MNQDPLVSIIISSYNYDRFIRETIDSALNQTYANKEVIVVDDGSRDSSPEIIASYSNQIISILKENAGQGSAFNEGFKVSNGEVIIFLDSDDTLLPNAAANAVKLFEDSKTVKVHWPLFEINELGERNGKMEPRFNLAEGDFRKIAIEKGPDNESIFQPPTSGNAWARHFLNNVLPMPEAEYKTCPDYYLFVLAPIYGEFRTIEEPQGCYRIHGNNYSLTPLDVYVKELIQRFDFTRHTLFQHLNSRGIQVDQAKWDCSSWFHKIDASLKQISNVVPLGASFILANENHWKGNQILTQRKHIHFVEKDGLYNGLPENDDDAIIEIERQRKLGVNYILFTWTAFWILDYYKNMRRHLETYYKLILNTDLVIGFDLKPTVKRSYLF